MTQPVWTEAQRQLVLEYVENQIHAMLQSAGAALFEHARSLPDDRLRHFVDDFSESRRTELLTHLNNTLHDVEKELANEQQ